MNMKHCGEQTSAIAVRLGILLLVACVPVRAATIWAPMWDQRAQTKWEVKASATTVKFFTEHEGVFNVYDSANNLLGSGNTSTPFVLGTAIVGATYEMRYTSGFHVRPHWEGAEWVRAGAGTQAAGPGTNIGFQSDAELGFDSRWGHLPSQFADTTWFYNVAAGETLSISVEHMTGDIRGAKRFDWVRPDGTVVVADADGMPGSGGLHYQARSGDLFGTAPDTSSVYWQEYVAPAAIAGTWGFKLSAFDLAGQTPYSWHYVLDRTDPGADQFSYLRAGSILDPNLTLPEPGVLALVLAGLAITLVAGRRGREVGGGQHPA